MIHLILAKSVCSLLENVYSRFAQNSQHTNETKANW